jgi:hypothetical protein
VLSLQPLDPQTALIDRAYERLVEAIADGTLGPRPASPCPILSGDFLADEKITWRDVFTCAARATRLIM